MHNSRKNVLPFKELEVVRLKLEGELKQRLGHRNDLNLLAIYFLLQKFSLFIKQENLILEKNFPEYYAVLKDISLDCMEIDYSSLGYLIDYIFQFNLESQKVGGIKNHNLRKALGAYFTPFEISSFIVKQTVTSFDGISVLDPACGTGVFLSSAAEHMFSNGKNIDEIMVSLYGWDKSQDALNVAQTLISIELGLSEEQQVRFMEQHSFVQKDTIFEFIEEDSLFSNKTDEIPLDISFIVTNPPYDRLKADKGTPEDKANLTEYADKIKRSNKYHLSTTGSLDLYRLFVERIIHLANAHNSKVGIIIPASFAGDKSAYELRKEMVDSKMLSSVMFIPEKAKAFEGVSQAFSILFFAGSEQVNSEIKISTCINTKEINWDDCYKVNYSDIQRGFPVELNIVHMPQDGYALLQRLNKFPTIKSLDYILNKRGELDLSINKHFLEGEANKLLRGKHVGEYSVDKNMEPLKYQEYLESIKTTAKYKHIHSPRLVCQQISNMDSKKRLKFAMAPEKVILGNSLNYIYVDDDKEYAYGLLAIMNSILMDWRFRISSTNNHINNYEVDSLPLPDNKDKIRALGISTLKALHDIDRIDTRSNIENIVLSLYNCEEYKTFLVDNHPLGATYF